MPRVFSQIPEKFGNRPGTTEPHLSSSLMTIADGTTRIQIPDDLHFADLRLGRKTDNGNITFSIEIIERVCAASGIDTELVLSCEDNVSELIVGWYAAARQAGEPPDPVAEELLAEVRAEDTAGQSYSHQPGRA